MDLKTPSQQVFQPETRIPDETKKAIRVTCPRCGKQWWASKKTAEKDLNRHLGHCRPARITVGGRMP